MRRALFALALFALPAAAAERMATGEATYLARIVLPDDAMLSVETRDEAGALFSESRKRTEGRQVPLPFGLPAPPGGGTLRVAIMIGGEARWLSAPVPLAAAGPLDLGAVRLEPFLSMGFVSRMRCGREMVLVGVNGGDLVVEARGARHRLSPAPAASGARYVMAGSEETFFWSKGEAATLSLCGEALPECALAPLPGPEFRAGGNEPGWDLAVKGGEAVLTLDYGAERRVAPLPPPGIDADGATVIASEALGAAIRIEEKLCHDDATGMPHPFSVSVALEGRTLAGCGGRPLDLLLGGEWIVEELSGAALAGDGRPTLLFVEAEGRVAGFSGCNRYNAGVSLTGESLTFDRAAMTMMACAPEVMARERAFADALEAAAGFDIVEGALLLRDAAGGAALRARR